MFAAFTAMGPVHADDVAPSRLGPLPIDPGSVTVSGISSGGAMAAQFHTAHSALVRGVGVLAAAPYLCAEASVAKALGRCMTDGAAIPVDALLQQADQLARDGAIDPLSGMQGDRVWLYRGTADPYVHGTVADALERYYRAATGDANLVRIERDGAGHNFPVVKSGESPCAKSESPYLGSCGYDAARALLEHLYGHLEPNTSESNLSTLQAFDQRPYAQLAGSDALDELGWLYVPAACAQGTHPHCRLHVVFHGCRQGRASVADAFARRAGYLEVAEANDIVLLFPQVKPTTRPLNPLGCWDWWGYEGADYATQRGPQVRAVRAMVDDLLGTGATKP
jgi:poly(3-hydroxybutyrate) depolymerase